MKNGTWNIKQDETKLVIEVEDKYGVAEVSVSPNEAVEMAETLLTYSRRQRNRRKVANDQRL